MNSENRKKELGAGITISEGAWTDAARALLVPEVVELLSELHRHFYERRQLLLAARRQRQLEYDGGRLPGYEPKDSVAVQGSWRVAPVPADLRIRRVEITGPVNSEKMVLNMLSRNADGARADTAMLDFEDSMKPTWSNVINGVHNVIGAANGTLRYETQDKSYRLTPGDMPVVIVRTRGLHLDESNFLVDGKEISGGLFDLVLCFYHSAKTWIARGKTPAYYIPKTEHYLEARWWNDVFNALQSALGLPSGTLRATFLIETLPAAFQIEEILYEIREHAAGLNVGRWDKIFSDIKVLRNHPDRIMADRATITMQKPWMENYAMRLIKICHERGAYAIGGMSAFTPGKTPALREMQTAKVIADKANEFAMGHDGCWVSHPYFITHALAQFTRKEQTDCLLPDFGRYPDLLPKSEPPCTIQGLRTNIRVAIAYQYGWNHGAGCISLDGLMEDLATLEISRAQTWQWLHHKVVLEDGRIVTQDLIHSVFEQELDRILEEAGNDMALESAEKSDAVQAAYRVAAADAQEIFSDIELKAFFRSRSDEVSSPCFVTKAATSPFSAASQL